MAPQSAAPIEVFYSYSHKDEDLRDKLDKHLTTLKRQGVIQGWHDRGISGGREWDGVIDEHLNSADIILLLISADFLASDYCQNIEVTRAMERHAAREARVVPVILRPCPWQDEPFGKVQALPKDARPVTTWRNEDEAFLDIAKGIRKVAEELREARQGESLPLTEDMIPTAHPNIPDILRVSFVSRKDRDDNDVVERLKDELAPGKKRLVTLWGSGGVGKTAIGAEAARALVAAFEQRVIWISAAGREDFNLTALLDGIATQLGQPDLRKLALEPKRERLREVLMSAPTLVVLDNFETIAPAEAPHCAEWLAQPALCSSLITSRQHVEAAHRNIPIGPMSSEEAHALLEKLFAEVHDVDAFANLDRDRLITTADANPLVLQWIVRQIDLAQGAEEVLNDLKHGEGTAAERVFDRSFNLKQLDNGGRDVLLALSLFVPSATRKALAEVAGLGKDKDRARYKGAVKALSSLWLLRTAEAGERVAVEGLTRELSQARLTNDPRSKPFRQRYVARFLHLVEANSKVIAEHFNSLETEKDNILNAIEVSFELGDWESAMRIGGGMKTFLRVRGYWDEAIRTGERALTEARSQPAEAWVASLTHNLAIILQQRGKMEEARRLYDESLEIERRLGNQSGVAITLYGLGSLTEDEGDKGEAARLFRESLIIFEKLGSPHAKTVRESLKRVEDESS